MPTADGKILFALDYDGTYTADPELWLAFIKLLRARGHEVLVATMRTANESESMCPKLLDEVHQVVYTHRRAKREYLAFFGLIPDIWIDDNPHFLFQNGASELPVDAAYEQLLKLRG